MRQQHFLKLHSNLALGAALAEPPRPRLKTVMGWHQAALRAIRAAPVRFPGGGAHAGAVAHGDVQRLGRLR